MKSKKEIRKRFRDEVFLRDGGKCVICGKSAVDAHHITDRDSPEMPYGGYVKENGVSLCADHHIMAEKFHISGGAEWEKGLHPDDLYRMIGSSKELAIEKSLVR